jgi:hypothetical protein
VRERPVHLNVVRTKQENIRNAAAIALVIAVIFGACVDMIPPSNATDLVFKGQNHSLLNRLERDYRIGPFLVAARG